MIPFFVVDAFSFRPFSGNPAAICLLDSPASDPWMQAMASEVNLAETAFVQRDDSGYHLRWFTPTCEVDLCGHATLAASHVLWQEGWVPPLEPIQFRTRSGILSAHRNEQQQIVLDFPQEPAEKAVRPIGFERALGLKRPPIAVLKNRMDWLVHVDGPEELRSLQPNLDELAKLGSRGWIVTCSSDVREYDFLSRFFGPAVGIAEDPVTGSAHCCLAVYWSDILNKTKMTGFQASRRGGVVGVSLHGERTLLMGQANTVVWGHCQSPQPI